jgi:hypothetical protein
MRYNLRRVDSTAILFPPHSSRARHNSNEYAAALKNVSQNPIAVDCDLNGKMVTLRWNKRTALLVLKADSYVAEQKESGKSADLALGMNVDPFREIGAFRAELFQLEERGCLKPAEAQRILRAVPEEFPLPPLVGYHFQLGNFDTTRYFDLTPEFRMEVISPAHRYLYLRFKRHLAMSPARLEARMDSLLSFPVGLFHPLVGSRTGAILRRCSLSVSPLSSGSASLAEP